MAYLNQAAQSLHSEPPTVRPWELLLVFGYCLVLLPLLSYSLLNHPAEYDELLHILAARGLDATGIPTIGSGEYPRALLYTHIISLVNELGSNELLVSRMPALISGMLLVALVGVWVTIRVGWLAGLAAATVLALAPSTIHLSVLVRFYTLHALCVTAMVILMYEALLPPVTVKRFLVCSALAVAACLLALQLQILTLVTLLGALAGLTLVIILDYHRSLLSLLNGRWWLIPLGLIALALAALATLTALDFNVVDKLRGVTPAWSVDKANFFAFYPNALGSFMPFIWPVFPVLALAALLGKPRLALYTLVIVLVAMTVSSLASQKATRYIYHFFPVICIAWGIGLQTLVRSASNAVAASARVPMSTALVTVLLTFAISLFNTEEVKRGLKLLTGRGTLDKSIPVMNEPDWPAARAVLDPLLADTEDLIVSSGVKSIHAFDRYDVELNKTVVAETPSKVEFGLDTRTGGKVISTVQSLNTLVDDPGREVVVLENRMMNQPYSATTEVVNWLDNHCKIIPLPESTRLTAWECLNNR